MKISKLIAIVCLFWVFLVTAVAEGTSFQLTLAIKAFSILCGGVLVYCLYRWKDDDLFDGIWGEKD